MTAGAQLRDQGIADALAADCAVTRDYASLVRQAVDRWSGSRATFTAEDVRAVIDATHPGAEPHHPNVLGGALKALAAEGRLVQVGWREASRPEARARPLRVWRAVQAPPAIPPVLPHGAGVEEPGEAVSVPPSAPARPAVTTT